MMNTFLPRSRLRTRAAITLTVNGIRSLSLGGRITQYSCWVQDCWVDCSKFWLPCRWPGAFAQHCPRRRSWGMMDGRRVWELRRDRGCWNSNQLHWWGEHWLLTLGSGNGLEEWYWPWTLRVACEMSPYGGWRGEPLLAFLGLSGGAVAHCHLVISREPGCFLRINILGGGSLFWTLSRGAAYWLVWFMQETLEGLTAGAPVYCLPVFWAWPRDQV